MNIGSEKSAFIFIFCVIEPTLQKNPSTNLILHFRKSRLLPGHKVHSSIGKEKTGKERSWIIEENKE